MRRPVDYTPREITLLGPYLDFTENEILQRWVEPFLNTGTEPPVSLDLLTSVNAAIPLKFRYATRHEEGVQSVEETLTLGVGTCRDFAHLFIEIARSLGVAARYVTGYLCSSPSDPGESHTHGWCELYLPGAGWRGFDPTNGILAGGHHVVVASSVTAGEIPPVEGSYCGPPGLCTAHDVTISARELLPGERP